ncbi:Tctex-1 family protein [Cryptosporidium muris RN66]|uniref:Tctex-1 family protein n=1 Tax=Cryptosporidium muris (strain RN66) TaxID=441375 RepID=B6AIH3_CRYMR|nr:Tctex-1 family protein [Cryptosporidium muris RN66]EEA08014.1 Tctex-1 family protein [Cryptosporidium muris RN66]|eukprot:XP_002142363.1 Tctex-1 family protein [Cryptosporidium muris RN66]
MSSVNPTTAGDQAVQSTTPNTGAELDIASSNIGTPSVTSFSSIRDNVQDCIVNSINSVLDQSTEYSASDVTTWVDSITSNCLDNLRKLSEKFKYIVSVMVLQRSPAGFHLFTTCYWDQANDGSVTHRWDNKNLHCVVVVYGVAY